MIRSIFLSHFHPDKGPRVLHQVPEGSIVPSRSPTAQNPLFEFRAISDYIIPRQELCNETLIVCTNRYRVIGYPVCLVDGMKYERNEFIFNCALVLDEHVSSSSFEGVVKKLADLFKDLEEESSIISQENSLGDVDDQLIAYSSKTYSLIEMILEDLNNFCECMLPIDESNTLNLKLFPTYPPPPSVKGWHVPLSTVRLAAFTDDNWDLTLLRILPFVNGVNSVAMIANLADIDFQLTQKAISHLLYYGCLVLLDIFQFSAVYAATPDIDLIFTEQSIQQECSRYISTSANPIKTDVILQLYAELRQGVTIRSWCVTNQELLAGLDIRRFITFGVIKGFLYRVQKYAVSLKFDGQAVLSNTKASIGSSLRKEDRKRFLTQFKTETNSNNPVNSEAGLTGLVRYLNGMFCFDQICTELRVPEATLSDRLKEVGHVRVIQK